MTVERWIASVDLGVGENGRRLPKTITGPSRKAVADKLRKLQREAERWLPRRLPTEPKTTEPLVRAALAVP